MLVRLVAVGLAMLVALPRAVEAAAPDFARDIRPVLAERCWKCHGRDEPQADLSLASLEAAMRPAASGATAITPGQPETSELVRRIRSDDATERMPPEGEKPLTAEEIGALSAWVAAGARWGEHWAFAPLADVAPPAVRDEAWPRNAVDRFVLARLEAEQVEPSPEADRDRLIKRLSYDLLGLPPMPEEVDAFHRDAAPDAYEQLVERLLSSKHFGERWGRHWLDLAHYADSDGYEKDRARPDAFHYRDWVIHAINCDLPFDQFTILQLAGDLLPGATADDRLATAFLRQTLTNEEGGVDQEEFRVNACFDRTDTVGTVWLGLTVGCAKCHAHKYDPLSHAEYYQLFAYFNGADEDTTDLPLEAGDRAALLGELAPLEAALAARHRELAPAEAEWEAAQRQQMLSQPAGPRAEHALAVARVELADSADGVPRIEGEQVWLPPQADGNSPERQTLRVDVELGESRRVTGFKLVAVPDETLPGNGPGRADNGNFVITGLRVARVEADDSEADGSEMEFSLHRAEADYAQPGYAAAQVLRGSDATRRGWAVGGKLGVEHWLQVRTREPIELSAGSRLRVVIEQQHGGRHTLGRFRLMVVTGDEAGLHLGDESIVKALRMYPEKRVAKTRQDLFDYYVREVSADEDCRKLEQQIAEVRRRHQAKIASVRTVGRARLPRVTRVFHRGEFLSPAEEVSPGTPTILPVRAPRGPQADRLDLAEWLVSAENPLTPRVVVNQVWRHLFGQALVGTVGDFGLRGDAPSHPELLDWLAGEFRGELQWSRKALIRRIVTSAAYRQSSRRRGELVDRDPGNRWLARQGRFRVEAEIVRDLTLAASGLLAPKIGGPSVFPPMPEELAKLSYANNFTWKNSEGDDQHRRGLYTFLKRTILHPNLTTFDAPDANGACTARTVSNTPLQALLLLNNSSHLEACQALAARLRALDPANYPEFRWLGDETGLAREADELRLAYGFRCCVARPPTSAELDELIRLRAHARQYYQDQPAQAAQLLERDEDSSGTNADDAAWVVVARVLLNLDEFLTRE